MNIVKQDLRNKNQFLKFYEVSRPRSEVWKEGFWLMHIWASMYFDAVVVEVKKNLLLFRLAQAILCEKKHD